MSSLSSFSALHSCSNLLCSAYENVATRKQLTPACKYDPNKRGDEYCIAEIFGSGFYLANWWFCFGIAKIKPPKCVRDSLNGVLSL